MTRYGPHAPEETPMAVVVLGPWKWPQPTLVDTPAAIVRQRAALNALAHVPRGVGGLPGFDPPAVHRPRPVQATAATPRGRARLVECAILARRGRPVPLMWGQ